MEKGLLEKFGLEFMWYLGRGEYGVLTSPRLIFPTPKMTTMCHLTSMKCQSAVKREERREMRHDEKEERIEKRDETR